MPRAGLVWHDSSVAIGALAGNRAVYFGSAGMTAEMAEPFAMMHRGL
jgi:hypothetical protein